MQSSESGSKVTIYCENVLAVVISESAAKKLSHATITEYLIPVNSNDVLLNLYGDDTDYKCFPDIGEEIKNGILCARRRMVNSTMLSSLNNQSLKSFNSNDNCFYSHGIVDSIYVYCNRDVNEEHDSSMTQIIKYARAQSKYDHELVEALTEASESGKLSSDAAYYFNRSRDSVNGKKWLAENSFDNVIVKIRVVNDKPAIIGSKITNRYGLKG